MICPSKHDTIRAICRALGIDHHANAHIVIDIKPQSIVRVFVEHYPTPADMAQLALELDKANRNGMVQVENVKQLTADIPDSSIVVKALPE